MIKSRLISRFFSFILCAINKSHVLQNLLINAPHVVRKRENGSKHNVAPSAFNIMMQMINDHLSALHSV